MKVVAERPWRLKDGKVVVEKPDVAFFLQGVIEKLREVIEKGPA